MLVMKRNKKFDEKQMRSKIKFGEMQWERTTHKFFMYVAQNTSQKERPAVRQKYNRL